MGSMRGNLRSAVIGAVVVGALLVAGCSSSGDDPIDAATSTTAATSSNVDEGTPVTGGTLTMAVAGETDGWNPATNQWGLEGQIVGSSFMEPLTAFSPSGDPVPWLAESVVPNEDASTWTIHLRKGIKFQDGTEMDAEAVAESLRFQGSPSALASVVTGSLIGDPVVKDQYTVEIPLTIRWGAFPAQLAANYGYIMAPSMLDKEDAGSTSPVGTGAYKFEDAEADRFLRVTAFDDYWGGPCTVESPSPEIVEMCDAVGVPLGQPNGPFLDSMEFRPIADSLQRSQALQAGDVDLIETKDPQSVATLRDDYQVVRDYGSDRTFVMLSASKAPFDNVHARRALAYATDRMALIDTISAGEEIGNDTSPFGVDSFWGGLQPEDTGYPLYDPAKAEEELALYKADMDEAGTPVQDLSFTLLGVATTTDLQVMQAIADQWATLGIKASIETLKQEEVITTLVGGKAQAILYQNYAYPDPDEMYPFWAEDFVNTAFVINFNQFTNATTQDALDLGRQSQDPEFRKKAYAALVQERNANAVDIWLYNTPWALIGEPNIRGLNWFRQIPFSSFTAKPWITSLWVDPAAS